MHTTVTTATSTAYTSAPGAGDVPQPSIRREDHFASAPAPAHHRRDELPLQDFKTYAALYTMYAEESLDYQEYKRRWRQQQIEYEKEYAQPLGHGRSLSLTGPIQAGEWGWHSPPSRDRRACGGAASAAAAGAIAEDGPGPGPGPCHALVQEITALSILMEANSRSTSLCASPTGSGTHGGGGGCKSLGVLPSSPTHCGSSLSPSYSCASSVGFPSHSRSSGSSLIGSDVASPPPSTFSPSTSHCFSPY